MLDAFVLAYVLVLCRVTAIIFTVPLFGSRNMPRLVKIGLAVSLTTFWFFEHELPPPKQVFDLATDPRWLAIGLAVSREIIFGAFLGYAFGLLLLPFRIAGNYIGQEVGFTMSQLTDPTSQETTNVFGQFTEVLAVLLFFSLNAHHVLFALVDRTFGKAPIGNVASILPVDVLSRNIAQAHRDGLLLIAPAAIVMFGTLVVLSYIAKTSPQLNLFSVGMNIRLLAGLFAVLMFLPEMLSLGERLISRATDIFRLLTAM